MNPGLYALASLNGAPLSERDLAVLGLTGAGTETTVHRASGIAVRAVDSETSAGSISFFEGNDGLACLLGYLDEPEALASALGGEALPQAGLAMAAVERYGGEAPVHMLGEWSFLYWHTQRRVLTVISSEARRDSIFFATNGEQVALSAEMPRLSRLPWVGLEIDPAGLALELSRAGLRHIARQETVCKRMFRVYPGSTEIFRAGGRMTRTASPRPKPELWQGSFDDAVDALNEVGRRIVKQQMERYGRTAFLLSGGLDSSLLTSWGARGQGQGREMFCLTSVAPEGTGLVDERQFSGAVAEALHLPLELVAPPASWSPYLPAEAMFSCLQSPMVNARHYLVQALLGAAQANGAHAVLDGVYGESSVTDKARPPVKAAWKRLALSARECIWDWRATRGWPVEAFHARFSKDLMAQLPGDWEAVWRRGLPRIKSPAAGEPSGILPSLAKNSPVVTASLHGLRHLAPYRDRRLIELAARMPKSFTHHGGLTRSLARAMLAGQVPDSIRLRKRGLPYSPDYELRLKRGAEAARARVAVYREQGLAEWLDLNWLSARFSGLTDSRNLRTVEMFRVQYTAMAAEFLLWMRAEAKSLRGK